MNNQNITKTFLVFISSLIIFLSFTSGHKVDAASYTMKAPDSFYSVRLSQEGYYQYNPFSNFHLTLEGWACDDKFAETAIYRIREINRLIQPLSETWKMLAQMEKVLDQMSRDKTMTLTKYQVESMVNKAIGDSIKKAGFTSEPTLIDVAESLSRDAIENARGGVSRFFGYWGDQNMFQNQTYDTPSGIWKISKIDPDDPPSVVFVAQNCYQKNDLETMMNSVVSAAVKLDEALTKYKETRDRLLKTTGK
jgi:hypothetical protein